MSEAASIGHARGDSPNAAALYLTASAGSLISKASMSELLELIDPPSLNSAAIAGATIGGLWKYGESFYSGVRTLPPNSNAYVENGALRFSEHTFPVQDCELQPNDAAIELRRQIDFAVERAVGKSRRVALLVGGLDSSGIAASLAAMRDAGKIDVAHLVTTHGAAASDDRPYVDELSRFLRLPIRRVFPGDGAPWMRSTLILDSSPHPYPLTGIDIALRHACKDVGAEVILSGGGGDRIFDGDTSSWSREFIHAPVRVTARALRFRMMQDAGPLMRWRLHVGRALFERAMPPKALRQWRTFRGVSFAPPWAGPALLRRIDETVVDTHSRRTATDRFHELSTVRDEWTFAFINARFDRLTGIGVRDVYLDSELRKFVASLPPETMMVGNRARGLFRLAFEGELPESILERHNKSDFEPIVQMMFERAGGYNAFEDLVDVRELRRMDMVDPKAFRTAWDHARNTNPACAWLPLLRVLAVEAFLRERT